jgi:hypothetical protein
MCQRKQCVSEEACQVKLVRDRAMESAYSHSPAVVSSNPAPHLFSTVAKSTLTSGYTQGHRPPAVAFVVHMSSTARSYDTASCPRASPSDLRATACWYEWLGSRGPVSPKVSLVSVSLTLLGYGVLRPFNRFCRAHSWADKPYKRECLSELPHRGSKAKRQPQIDGQRRFRYSHRC